jgi:undecaprenyl-diphosphatase
MTPLRFSTGIDVVSVLTDLGSFPCVAVLVGVTARIAAVRGRPEQALGLVLGLVVVFVLVHSGKELWGRPRPEDRLASAGGLSFPSGHAAQATTWVACALVLARRELVIAAVAVAVAIAASRLYLHVHFLSDVVGGLALGTFAFALLLRR